MEGHPGVVISSGELGYLRRLAKGEGVSSPRRRDDSKKAQLKKMSEQRYRQWPDTLEAVREKRERARQERLEAAEARARAIDQEEADYQKEQRKRSIDRANRLLYEDTEPVRQLRGSLLLAQVAKEREAQIARGARQKEITKRQTAIFERQVSEAASKMLEREERERAQRAALDADARHGQLEQRRLVEERKARERAADKAEGERLRADAQRRAEEAVAKARAEEERKKAATAEFLAFNRKLEAQRHQQREAEEAEERRLAEFAAEKERQYHEKRAREAELFQQRMLVRGQLVEQEMERTRARLAQENQTLAKDVAALEERRKQRDEGDKERNKMLVGEVLSDWDAQLARKREAKEQQERAERELQERWVARAKAKEAEERAEAERKRLEAKELQEFLRLQMRTKAAEEAEQEAAQSVLVASALDSGRSRERFEEYTRTVLRESGVAPEEAKPVELLLGRLERDGVFQ